MTFLWVALYCTLGQGQATPPTILTIDVENVVQYFNDVSDVSRLATDPNVTTPVSGRNFREFLVLGDIVAVNGQPAKGALSFSARQLILTTASSAGQAIADVLRGNANVQTFEIQRPMVHRSAASWLPDSEPVALRLGRLWR